MTWFIHLTTRNKLFLSFGLMIAFLLAVIAIAFHGLTTLRQSQDELFRKDFLSSIELVQLRADQNRNRAQLLELIINRDSTKQKQVEQDIRDRTEEVNAGLKIIEQSILGFPKESGEFEEMVAILADYRQTRDEQLSLLHTGRIEEAETLATTTQTDRYNRIRDIASGLGENAMNRAKTRIAETDAEMRELSRTFGAIALIALLFCFGAVIFLNKLIAKPLAELTTAADCLAGGDPGVTIAAKDRKDEIGNLIRAFIAMIGYLQNIAAASKRIAAGDLAASVKPVSERDALGNAFVEMTGYLQSMAAVSQKVAGGDLAVTMRPISERDTLGNAFALMIGYLQNMASVSKQVAGGDLTVAVQPVSERDVLGNAFTGMLDNLRNINRELGSSVTILASSASEILASTTQIASGMVETATSVSETTATVEEVKQTAQLSAEKSRNVSDIATKAVTIADQGSSAVTETIEGIDRIKELMESVAESVVLLSEQTQAIGEIITVVNDLAQQSNLLAVNAAIEASKAGEQGRGFVVVAQEIKSLADQSKQATEQVRTILADIQKATGKSVLAAEQVSKAVELGVKQAADSGESIRILSESIGESSQAAAQIAVSSQQQLAGMEQVAMAMESIKMAAQQNVAGTKQVEQAAQTLNELGQRLKEMMKKYRV